MFSGWCEIGAITIFSTWCFLWLPFRRHLRREVDFIFEKSELKKEIEKLQKQLDERAEKWVNKSILGAFLQRLEERIRAIEKTKTSDYRDALKDGKDLESLDLINHIESFISKNIGAGEAAVFSSLAGINLTNFGPLNEWGLLRDLEEHRRKQIHMIDHLNHWAMQLKGIIKEYK
jgi:hypothetical protein